MGLFEKIFGKKQPPQPTGGTWQTMTGYTPAFTTWGGQLYESELIRASIDAIARAAAKLEVTVQGTAKPKLRAAVRSGPNPWQTWGQFLYRLITILYVRNTAFIVPIEDELGSLVGWAPILENKFELVQDERGNPWVRFYFDKGKRTALPLDSVGVVVRHQYRSDYFGETNNALTPTMELITMQQQGIPEAIKNSATFRFMARLGNFAKADDLRKERDRFNAEQLGSGSGGVLLFPNTWDSIQQITTKPYTVDADQMTLIEKQVFNYFGVNEDVLQNRAVGDSWSAFYEGCIEWLSIQISDVMSRMTFSDRERAAGNGIFLTANRLQYMSNHDKLEVSAQMADRGLMTVNEIRAIWNLAPLPPELGDRMPIRGEYYDAANPPAAKDPGQGAGDDSNDNNNEEVQDNEPTDPA